MKMNLLSAGRICERMQCDLPTLRRLLTALAIEPAMSLDNIEYFGRDAMVKLGLLADAEPAAPTREPTGSLDDSLPSEIELQSKIVKWCREEGQICLDVAEISDETARQLAAMAARGSIRILMDYAEQKVTLTKD